MTGTDAAPTIGRPRRAGSDGWRYPGRFWLVTPDKLHQPSHEPLKLFPDEIVDQVAFGIEGLPRTGNHQAAAGPKLRAEGAQDGKPAVLREDGAKASG